MDFNCYVESQLLDFYLNSDADKYIYITSENENDNDKARINENMLYNEFRYK